MSSATMTLIGMYNWDNTLFDNLQVPDGVDKATLIDNILIRSGEFEVMYSDFDFMKFSIGAWSRKWYPTLERWVDALSIKYNPLENYDRQEEWTDKRDISGNESGKSSGEDSGSESRGQTSNENGSEGRTEGGSEDTTEGRTESGSNSGTDGRTEHSTNSGGTTGTSGSTTTTNVSAYDGGNTYTPKEQLIVSASDGTTSSGAVSLQVSGLHSDLTSLTVSGASNKLTSLIVSAMHANTVSINVSGLHANKRSDEYSKDHKTDDDLEHKGRIHGNIGVTTSQQMLISELDLGYWNIYEKITDIFLTEFVIPVY